MYVLTEGSYDMREIKGVADTLEDARAWADGNNDRDYYGPFVAGMTEA